MIKDLRLLIVSILSVAGLSSNTAISRPHSGGNSFALTIPLVSMSRDANLGGEFNLSNKGTIGVEIISLSEGEELREKELEENPGNSLMTSGNEYRVTVSRYSRAGAMGGWFWGLGVGMRTVNGTWKKTPEDPDQFGLADEEGKVNHDLKITGNTLMGRFGYRYVGSSGFLAGIHLGVRHFQNKVVDAETNEESADPQIVEINDEDSNTLKRRLMSSMSPQIQLGWAF